MRIDSHIHLTPPDFIRDWRAIAEKEPYFWLLSHSKSNRFAAADDVLGALDAAGMDKGVVFGFGFGDMGLCRAVNDYTMESVRRHPDRLLGFAVIPPRDSGAEAELARCAAGGLRGVGELFAQGQGFSLTDKRDMQGVMAACRALHWPVLIHGNESVGHDYPGKTGDTPPTLAAFAQHFPDNTLIYAHWGGGLFLYELMPEMRAQLHNVYYDTAATPFLYEPRIYEAARAAGVLDKLLFGSDCPLLSPAHTQAHMEQSGLSPAERAAVLGGNAARLLALEGCACGS